MENNKQAYGYNGRVIRMAPNVEPRNTLETLNNEQDKADSANKNTTAYAEVQELAEYVENNDRDMNGKEELIRSLRRNVTCKNERHLIGVFGVYSDNLIKEALYEISHEDIGRNVTILPKSILIKSDIQKISHTHYKENYNPSSYAYGVDVRREVTRYLNSILCVPSAGYGQSGLSDAVMRLERHGKVKELMDYINLISYNRDNVFIWNLEVSYSDIHPNLLNNLSKMVCGNFIIIVNFLRPAELEALALGSSYPVSNQRPFGEQLLQKYFGYEDLIKTD